MTRLTAFIPLKGHSARVSGKNLRPFDGAPLFHTIVRTLGEAQSVDGIYIDTDSDEIAASAAAFDSVTVLRRHRELEGDDVSVNLLIGAFLERVDAEHVIQTHATNPLLTAATIDRAAARYFGDESITSLFGVTRYQARFFTPDMVPVNHDPAELLPTQDLEPLLMENSNFYVFERAAFEENRRRITDRTATIEVDPLEAIDIDEERDFRMAELLLSAQRATTGAAP